MNKLEKAISKLWDNCFTRSIEKLYERYFLEPNKKETVKHPRAHINMGSGGRGAYQDENSFY